IKDRMHYVRIFPRGEVLNSNDLMLLQKRHRQLYVPETQRTVYLQSVCRSSGNTAVEKTAVLKDSAIHYLENIFDENKEFSTEMLAQTINGSRDVVANMVDMLQ